MHLADLWLTRYVLDKSDELNPIAYRLWDHLEIYKVLTAGFGIMLLGIVWKIRHRYPDHDRIGGRAHVYPDALLAVWYIFMIVVMIRWWAYLTQNL